MENCLVKWERFELLAYLTPTVAHCRDNTRARPNDEVIVKFIMCPDGGFEGLSVRCRQLMSLQCPYLIDVLGYGLYSNEIPFIVMEYARLGTVYEALSLKWLRPRQINTIIQHVLLGLCALHEGGRVHGDLSPPNIMLIGESADDMVAKLGDFGVLDGLPHFRYTPQYTAPEVLAEARTCGEIPKRVKPSADCWSAGLVVYELLCGQPVFARSLSLTSLLEYVGDEDLRPPLPRAATEVAGRLIRRCWVLDPAARPTVRELIAECEAANWSLVVESEWAC